WRETCPRAPLWLLQERLQPRASLIAPQVPGFPTRALGDDEPADLTPDQEHLHVPPRSPAPPAQFAVTVAATLPQPGDVVGQSGLAVLQPWPQVRAFAGEQA